MLYLCNRNSAMNMHVFLAQLVEQLTLNQWVKGSSPLEDTTKKQSRTILVAFFFAFFTFFLFLLQILLYLWLNSVVGNLYWAMNACIVVVPVKDRIK